MTLAGKKPRSSGVGRGGGEQMARVISADPSVKGCGNNQEARKTAARVCCSADRPAAEVGRRYFDPKVPRLQVASAAAGIIRMLFKLKLIPHVRVDLCGRLIPR